MPAGSAARSRSIASRFCRTACGGGGGVGVGAVGGAVTLQHVQLPLVGAQCAARPQLGCAGHGRGGTGTLQGKGEVSQSHY